LPIGTFGRTGTLRLGVTRVTGNRTPRFDLDDVALEVS
jgi:hypothetical protein